MSVRNTPWLTRVFPFLSWFPMTRETLRADLLAGITVTLILVPQSMAYAQLAGLPVVYGLYAAFLPVIVASLWGSLRQLHTGPTAMLSLLSAAAVIPYAAAGSETFIALSIMLALMVGVLRLVLGLFRLGLVVNFLSHPVVVGFTNAAALIIGLSQLNKLLSVPMPRSDFFLADLWVVVRQLGDAHWPTLLFALAAFGIIYGVQRLAPRAPGVLLAIIATTLASYAIGFEHTANTELSTIRDEPLRAQIARFGAIKDEIESATRALAAMQADLIQARDGGESSLIRQIELKAGIERHQATLKALREQMAQLSVQLRQADLRLEITPAGTAVYRIPGQARQGELPDDRHWRFNGINGTQVQLTGGGEVVGAIPGELPGFRVPHVDWQLVLPLLPAALIMALLGFMEATSISKAISAKTGQRVDTNRELVGQGLANIVGSFFQSYVVSGSFSRSAVAAREGARTGLFAIVSALGVMGVILFLTPLLYHLPQAVLAVIIMFAVFGLVRLRPLLHAWKVNRADALIGIATFVGTLALAPALADGILIGVGLTVVLYLLRNMRPRAEILGRHPDGVLGGMDTHHLPPIGENFIVLRFDGSLNFVNVAYFENAILQALERFPAAKALLVIGNGINDIDASGEEQVRSLALQLKARGVDLYFSSMKQQVRAIFERGGLAEVIPEDHLFKTKESALRTLLARYDGRAPGEASQRAGGAAGAAPPRPRLTGSY